MEQTAESHSERPRALRIRVATTRSLVLLAFLLFLPSAIGSQQPTTPEPRPPDSYKISVDVSSVVLRAAVTNHSGSPVSGLGKDDFRVYEDGVPQAIGYFSHDDIPVTVGLVLDNSGSMRPNRDAVIAAGMAFARSSNPQDQMFVVNFNEHVSLSLPAGTLFTDQPGQLQVALAQFRPDGKTALYDALALALDHLKLGNRDKKVLVVVSDGGDNASKYGLDQILALAAKTNAIIYAIDIHVESDLDRNPKALRRIAKATGGKDFVVEFLPEIVPMCERIARDIREQYTLAYSPTILKQDGAYRKIQVTATSRGHRSLSVLTREGYYAPLHSPPSVPLAEAPSTLP